MAGRHFGDREPEERGACRALAGARGERRVQRRAGAVVAALVGARAHIGVVRRDDAQPRGLALGDHELDDAVPRLQSRGMTKVQGLYVNRGQLAEDAHSLRATLWTDVCVEGT